MQPISISSLDHFCLVMSVFIKLHVLFYKVHGVLQYIGCSPTFLIMQILADLRYRHVDAESAI